MAVECDITVVPEISVFAPTYVLYELLMPNYDILSVIL